ncbi:MAG: hypothetical protein Q8M24_15565 [Pseudolabrys sp.]|nr:hypothetical protein [Pseudolabrys sp.]MDP2296861.1 hypothetical protein [Pseudolabrys sp.]
MTTTKTKSRGRPSTGGRLPQIGISVQHATLARIKARADAEFSSVSELAGGIIEATFGEPGAGEPSRAAEQKAQSGAIDLEMKQIRLSQIRKELLTVDSVVKIIGENFAVLRAEGLAFMAELAVEFGADVADLQRRFLERMAGGDIKPDAFEELAEEFSNVPLR